MSDFLTVFGAYDFAVREGLLLALVALSIHVLLSAGIFAVPQVGFMAVGAYTAAVLSVDLGWSVVAAVATASAASAVTAALLATVLGRLNGIYLAIASIAFAEMVRVAILNLEITGAAQGKVGVPRELTDPWIVLAVAAAAAGLVALRRSRAGLGIAAMRADAMMASHQGVDVLRVRLGLFTLSGGLAGGAGALSVHVAGFVEPGQFSFDLLTQLLAVVVIGGMTYVAGSFVGAAVIFGLPFTLAVFEDYQHIVNGALIVAVVAFAPGGIIGVLDAAWAARRRRTAPVPEIADVPAGPARQARSARTSTTTSSPGVAARPSPAPAGRAVLDVRDVSVAFGGVRALRGVSITAREGEVLGLMGPNGSGKTSLLNCLSGSYRPDTGAGELDGAALARLWGRPHRLAAAGVARTFQTIRLMDDLGAVPNVAVGAAPRDRRRRTEIAHRLLEEHGLGAVARTPVGRLPYGARRRVEIARALARRPSLLLLDEPTAGMSPAERESVFESVAAACTEGVAVVLVEHDVDMMRRFSDRLVVLDFGEVLAEGDADEVLDSAEVTRAYFGPGSRA